MHIRPLFGAFFVILKEMKSEQINPNWDDKKITPLEDPLGEFNVRGGLNFDDYQNLVAHMNEAHPEQGKQDWDIIKSKLPSYEMMEDPSSLQKLRVQRFNWPTSSEDLGDTPVTIINSPFGIPIDLPQTEYRNFILAEAIRLPVLIIENPGYGDSEKLTEDQKKDLRSGSFHKVADSMLGIIESLGVNKINLVGYSMGSELAAAIAADAKIHQLNIENILIMESPRIEEQNPAKLAKNFANDIDNLKFTWQHPIDPVLREIAGTKLKVGLPKGLFTYGIALFQGGIKNDLETALKDQPNMKLTIANAGSSTISSSKANSIIFEYLKQEYPEHNISRIVIPGESHAFADNVARFASLVDIVFNKR
jgi:hypothetical protein